MLAVVAVLGMLGAAAPTARGADGCSRWAPSAVPDSPRIEAHSVDGIAVRVLLPASYGSDPGRRYPVLLLLHGAFYSEVNWLAETDLLAFTAGLEPRDEAIVVMPDGGSNGLYSDWEDGTGRWETLHLRHVLPWVAERYRTLPGGAHRAVAGFSLGGFGAMHYAGRHPELFAAAAAFSGTLDLREGANAVGFPAAAGPAQAVCNGRAPRDLSPYGSPLEDDWLAEHNPADLAPRYARMAVYVSAGNGVPCDGDLRGTYSPAHLSEPGVRRNVERFVAALERAGVAHTARFFACGLHVMPAAQRALHDFWPLMADAVRDDDL